MRAERESVCARACLCAGWVGVLGGGGGVRLCVCMCVHACVCSESLLPIYIRLSTS